MFVCQNYSVGYHLATYRWHLSGLSTMPKLFKVKDKGYNHISIVNIISTIERLVKKVRTCLTYHLFGKHMYFYLPFSFSRYALMRPVSVGLCCALLRQVSSFLRSRTINPVTSFLMSWSWWCILWGQVLGWCNNFSSCFVLNNLICPCFIADYSSMPIVFTLHFGTQQSVTMSVLSVLFVGGDTTNYQWWWCCFNGVSVADHDIII